MKKLALIAVIVLVAISLTACHPMGHYFDYEELKAAVVSVELINYDNPDSKRINGLKEETKPFDFDKVEVLEVLAEEKIDDFLYALSDIEFFKMDYSNKKCNDSANGVTIIVKYSSGDFLVLDSKEVRKNFFVAEYHNFIALYNSFGELKEHNLVWTDASFEVALVNRFFTAYHFEGYEKYSNKIDTMQTIRRCNFGI